MNDVFPAVFLGVFGLVLLALLSLFVAGTQREQRQLMERIASRFRGRTEGGDIFSPPQVRLKFEGYPALLKFVGVGKQTHTVFTITWPDSELRCELNPQDIFTGLRKLWGLEDIEIGSPQFDAAYVISGNKHSAVRDLLAAPVQIAVMNLAALQPESIFNGGWHEVQVKWAGGVLTITKPCKLVPFKILEQFVTLCGLLFTAAIATRQTGIEFVGDVREPDNYESQCQVCGEPLAGELVYCANCKTPSHRDCWEYFGGCSTYACGGKKCVERPKARSRKAS